MLKRYLSQHLGGKPKTITSRNKTTFTVEVLHDKQSKKMRSPIHLNELPVNVEEHCDNGVTKGQIFIYEYDMSDFENFFGSD